MRYVVLSALALIFVGIPARASERLIRHFDHDHGLPASEVSSFDQDRQGFLWLGTSGGLVRWDGREMRRVLSEALTGRDIHVAAHDGGVLAAGSLGIYDLPDGGTPRQLTDAHGAPITRVWAVRVDARGRFWVLTQAAVYLFADGNPAPTRPLPAALE